MTSIIRAAVGGGATVDNSHDIAVIDRAIASAAPGATTVQFGDCWMQISALQVFRQRLVAEESPQTGAQPNAVSPATGTFTPWPGGTIPYRFDPTQVSNGTLTAAKMQQFRDGTGEWQAAANVHFVEFTGTTPANFITVQEDSSLGGGESTAVGMQGGEQFLQFGPQAWNRGTVCHEMGHALGYIHEQQRDDRDTYVIIDWNNIPAGQQANFTKLPGGATEYGPYDFYSVMEYARNALAIDPSQDTITMQPAYAQYANIIGNVPDRTLSTLDRAGMATIYGSPSTLPGAVVTNTNDSGIGSLRSAIYYAFDRSQQSPPLTTTITFQIPKTDSHYNSMTGVFTISPTYELDALGDGTTIDGTTQTTFTGDTNTKGPEVVISGAAFANYEGIGAGYQPAFILRQANCVLKDLVIQGCDGGGINITGTAATGNVVSGCYVGTDATGTSSVANAVAGIDIFGGAHNNTIGGTTATARNVISGNTNQGIVIVDSGTTGNIVEGNYIGLNPAGTAAVPNGTGDPVNNYYYPGLGIFNGAAANTIGGTVAGAANVISGNSGGGVSISGTGSNANIVEGNFIGTNPGGTAAIANGNSGATGYVFAGLELFGGTQSNVIGGTTAAARNIISGNAAQGLFVGDFGSNSNVIEGNYIGTDVTGVSAVPNGYSGIGVFNSASNNTIGGTVAGAQNIISGNAEQGIAMGLADPSQTVGPKLNVIEGNLIGVNINGAALANGYDGIDLYGGAQSNTVGGLTTTTCNIISGNSGYGVNLSNAGTSLNVIEGNVIGMNSAGTAAVANGFSGLSIFGAATNNTIGGTTAAARNLISGNSGYGIQLSGTGTSSNVVEGNYIGVDTTGAHAFGNAFAGVDIDGGATSNAIGGVTAAARNIISGNPNEDVVIDGTGTSANVVEGNYIGLDTTGATAIPASNEGIAIFGSATGNTIGGTAAGSRNYISGHSSSGIAISDSGTNGNIVAGNTVGLNVNSVVVANAAQGVALFGGAQSNVIGGATSGAGNIIAGNSAEGVAFFDNTTLNNTVSENSIFGNSLGIALYSGSNNNQTAPGLSSAVASSGGTTVAGTLSSSASKTFRIEFFSSPSGNEGQTFLGSANVTTNSAGTASINTTLTPIVAAGSVVTATATDPTGDTSAFSSPVTVTGSGNSGPPGAVMTQPAVANSDQATLSWTAVSGATSYIVGRSTVSGGPYTTVSSGSSATSFTDTNLTDGVTYYYVISAVNGSGTGPNSAQIAVTPTAQNLFWDTTTATGLANGSGSWDNGVTANWSSSSAGTSNPLLAWFSDDNASFQTTGTLTATVPTGTTIKLGSLTQALAGTYLTVTGGSLQFDSNAGIINAAGTTHSMVIASPVVLNSPSVAIDSETASGTIQLNGVISETGGSRAMNKIGPDGVTLGTVANTFSGGFVLGAAGQVVFGNNASFGTGPITFNAGTSLTSTAQIYASSASVTALANALTFNAGSFGAYTGTRSLVLSGNLLGSGTFYISPTTGATSVTLSGDDHTFTGNVVYNDNGTTSLLLGATSSGSASATWTLVGGKTRGIGANVTGSNTFLLGELSSASATGRLFNNQASGTATFQLGDATANVPSFTGVIADGTAGGKVGITKTGTDNQILTGANTYTGPTTISAGTLTVNGSLAAGGAVTIGAAATLAGTGTISATTTLTSSGVIAPGGSGTVGKLTLGGGATFNGGGILSFDLAATTASDSLALAGTYVPPGSGTVTINLNALGGFANGTYPLITGASGISASSFALGTTPGGHGYQLSVTGSTLSVIVSAPLSTPAAPTSLVATPANAEVDLTWSSSTGASTYTLMRGTVNGGPYPTLFSGLTSTSFADHTVTNGTTYYYVVTATNSAGTSGNSNQANATPIAGATLPAQVAGVTATPGANQVALSWMAVSGAASYTIGRATTSGGPYATVSSGSAATTFTNTGLTNGTPYYYVVAAVNTAGTGPNSVEVTATPGSQNLYWDATTAAGLANGSGSWDNGVTAKWSNTSAGTSNPLLTWASDDGAVFQTTGTLTATIPTGTTIKAASVTQAAAGTYLTVTGGTLQLDSNAGVINAVGTTHSMVIASALVLNSPSVTIDSETASGTIQLNGLISEMGGSRALNKIGPDAVTLGTVANTFTGGFVLSAAGQVLFGNNASFGTGPITFSGGTSLTSTAQLYTATTTVTALANALMFNAGSFGAYTGTRAMVLSGNLLGNGTFYVDPTTGAASVTLSGDNHNFAGNIVYNDNGSSALLLGTATSGSANAIWTLVGGKTKGIGANVAGDSNFLLGELSSASAIGRLFNNQASGTATFVVGDATTNAPSFTGIIADGTAGGKVGVTKTGADNQILTGANTYTGPTAISGGTLTISGSLAAGSTVTVSAGGTLAGTGTISGATNLSSIGNIAPGGSGTVGKLTLAGGFNLNSGGVLSFDLATPTTSDTLALTGAYVAPASGTVTVNLNALSGFANGTYPLVTGATGISASSFTLGSTPSGHSYQLTASGATLSVVVSATGGSAPAAPTGLAASAANAEVDLAWSASSGATSYNVLRGTANGGPYATIVTGLASTAYSDVGLTNGITYYYVVTATSGTGTSGNSNQAVATPNTTTVDSFWSDNDIGTVGQAGNSSYSNGTFTLNGSGTGVSGTADSLDFTYQTLVGDGAIITEVATQSAGASGVMMRETSAANSRVVDLVIQAGVGAVFQDRTGTGGSAVNGATVASIAVPYWVKLARAGNVFTGYISPDGITWTQVGTITNAMASSISVGLTQSSLSNSLLANATFTNTSIVPTSDWASTDIGTVPIVGASYFSNGIATVQGAGTSLYSGADQFRFTYLSVSGDCDITARVATETNTAATAKAGVMIRANLTASSVHAMVYVTPSSGVDFEWRGTTNGTASSTAVSGLKAPYWLRLVRSGNTFTAFRSPDGTTWTAIGSPETVVMGSTVYVGLPVCSYSASAACTATFDHITVDP